MNAFKRLYEGVNPWADGDIGGGGWRKFAVRAFHRSQIEFKIRYLPILKELGRHPERYETLLEVGSGPIGVSIHTKKNVTGVDLDTGGPHFPNMKMVKGDATALPFADASFDLVIALDVLEHMPRAMRAKAVAEALRVAKKRVYVGCPCGPVAREWEAKVYRRLQERIAAWNGKPEDLEKFKKRFWYLVEHTQNVLPDRGDLVECLKLAGAGRWTLIENESVKVWYWSVTRFLEGSHVRWFLITLFYLLFFPVLARVKWGGHYRDIFVIEKNA